MTDVDYDWNLRLRLAEKGIYKAAELRPLLAERGIRLSDSQIWRLITGRLERLNLRVLAVLCELLGCTPNDLITVRALDRKARLEKAASGDRGIAGLTPAKARYPTTASRPHDVTKITRRQEPCLRCGRLAAVQRRVDGRSMCASCERRWLNSKAPCDHCQQYRRPALGEANAGLCETCAGISSTQVCGRCGAEEDLYASARCAACYLADEIDRLRATGNPAAVRTLDGYLAALRTARPANSALHWLRISRTSAAPILRDMVAGARPITHDALDQAPPGHATEFLRAALVTHRALPERDEVCHRFERWIIAATEQLPDQR